MLPKAARVIQKYLDNYEAVDRWDPYRAKRTQVTTSIALKNIDGDILEIGAHVGTSTNVFCLIAAKHDRKVFVIDPWDGRQQGNNGTFQRFREATAQCTNLIVHHMGSEHEHPRQQFLMDETKFAFILIDGLHNYDAVKNDIEKYAGLLMPGGILCIDDWHGPYAFSAAIKKAAYESLDDNWKQLSHPESLIETYFVKLA